MGVARPIFDLARELGLLAFSSPFDPTAVEFLEDLEVPAYKIASSEIVDLPLDPPARRDRQAAHHLDGHGVGRRRSPRPSRRPARTRQRRQVMLLSCTASYPADPASSNLRGIPVMREAFGVPVGLSDHTMGIGAAVASVAFGAVLVEKHVTMSREEGGRRLGLLPRAGRAGRAGPRRPRSRGRPSASRASAPATAEREGLRFRRSLFVVEDVKAGDPVTAANVRSIRPAERPAPRRVLPRRVQALHSRRRAGHADALGPRLTDGNSEGPRTAVRFGALDFGGDQLE